MASVQHLYGLSYNIPRKILETSTNIEEEYKRHFFAAVKIQALLRGYLVKRMIKNWNRAATAIQRMIRGWRVRCHREEYYVQYYLRIQMKNYHLQATKIQALWRGYLIRKNLQVVDKIRNDKKLQSINEVMGTKLKELFDAVKSKERDEDEAKKAVLFTLFKTHHLLRTYVEEGIASLHGKKELSRIEKLMKSIAMKNYMKSLREIYNRQYPESLKPPANKFASKKLNKLYTLYSQMDKSNDLKEKKIQFEEDLHKEPFKFDRKPITYKYEPQMLYEEKYVGGRKNILERTFDNANLLSEHDFDLYVHKMGKLVPKLPPYYIDFWERKKCPQHHIDYLFS